MTDEHGVYSTAACLGRGAMREYGSNVSTYFTQNVK